MRLTCRAPHCTEEVSDAYAVCRVCWDFRPELLGYMPFLWVRVHGHLMPSGRTALRERVTTTAPGSSVPMRDGPLYALEYSLNVMSMWADTFLRRGCAGVLPERGRAREGLIFDRAVAICKQWDHELTASPLAGDYYCDIYRAHWTLARVDNDRADAARLLQSCPACDRATLIERNAGEHAQCLTCGRNWTQAALLKEARG
jgi:hypothetical protein